MTSEGAVVSSAEIWFTYPLLVTEVFAGKGFGGWFLWRLRSRMTWYRRHLKALSKVMACQTTRETYPARTAGSGITCKHNTIPGRNNVLGWMAYNWWWPLKKVLRYGTGGDPNS